MSTRIEVMLGVEHSDSDGYKRNMWITGDRKITGGFDEALVEIPRILKEVRTKVPVGDVVVCEQISFTRNLLKGGWDD